MAASSGTVARAIRSSMAFVDAARPMSDEVGGGTGDGADSTNGMNSDGGAGCKTTTGELVAGVGALARPPANPSTATVATAAPLKTVAATAPDAKPAGTADD